MDEAGDNLLNLIPNVLVGDPDYHLVALLGNVDHEGLPIIAGEVALWLAVFRFLEVGLSVDAIHYP